jgi:alpha-beta hydrolase superfamily lysophospholipase
LNPMPESYAMYWCSTNPILTSKGDLLPIPSEIEHKIKNPEGSRQLNEAALSTDKTLKLYGGHFHDLLHDLGSSDVAMDLLEWLDDPANASGRTSRE